MVPEHDGDPECDADELERQDGDVDRRLRLPSRGLAAADVHGSSDLDCRFGKERRLTEREQRLLSLLRPPWRTNISEKGEREREAESVERREWRDESVQRAPSATADSQGSCSLKVDWNNYLAPL